MARLQAVNQQKSAVAAAAATSTAAAAAAVVRSPNRPKRGPAQIREPAQKKNKKLKPAAAGKEIDAGKEIVAGKEIGAENDLFSSTNSTLDEFFLGTGEAGQSDDLVDITPVAEIPTEIEGSSGSLVGKTYNLRTRPPKNDQPEESGSDDEDEDNDETEDDSADAVAKKRDVTPTKIHQNVARLKGSGNRGRPIVPVSPSGTLELSF